MTLKVKPWNELSRKEINDIFSLRSEVFIVEQECPYQDVDNKDMFSQHFFGQIKNEIVCYTRVFLNEDPSIIGRLVVKKQFRNRGIGREIMRRSINIISKEKVVFISAQSYLKEFYESVLISPKAILNYNELLNHLVMVIYMRHKIPECPLSD